MKLALEPRQKKDRMAREQKKCTVIRLNSPLSDSALITDPYSARRDNCDHPLVSATMTERLKEQKTKKKVGEESVEGARP